ncbi:MAG: cyclic-di-AMP receptor [Oscillospiraceae bacterium]|nr:cyclic-di-AMP receptor [Oscillospiraceae bacterium]
MKLVMAIINSDDAQSVIRGLTQEGFQITKLATTGGFLMAGNVTIITGVEDSRVDEVTRIIREKSKSRSQTVPTVSESSMGGFFNAPLVEVTVGGATVFVIPIDHFEKI